MGTTQGGEYTNGRLNDIAQGHHLTWLTDACLENANLRLLVQQPYRERHTDLGIVASRRAHNLL